jgi:hypothetical protein
MSVINRISYNKGVEMKKQIKVIQDEENLVAVEVLANEIVAISQGIKKLRSGRLNDKCLILLIQNASPCVGRRQGYSKIGTTEIKGVLEGIESLESTFLKKKV